MVIPTLMDKLQASGMDFTMLVTPDHPTPCACKTHVSQPVPYLIYSSKKNLGNGAARYTEDEAAKTGLYVADGYKLIERLLAVK